MRSKWRNVVCYSPISFSTSSHLWKRAHQSASLPAELRFVEDNGDYGEYYSRPSIQDLVFEMDYCQHILEGINLKQTGIALRQVQEVVARASKIVTLIDGYVNAATIEILTVKRAAVAVRLLTTPRSVSAPCKAAASAFNQQHGGR